MRRIAQDSVLLLALIVLLIFSPRGPLTVALALGIPVVIGWAVLTLHFPERVETDDEGIAFFAYGRVHRFAWSAIERVRVRRFLVRDRVLVRISPASPWAGRYWLVDSLDNYHDLVKLLERRAGLAR
jgi:hypothetical protein